MDKYLNLSSKRLILAPPLKEDAPRVAKYHTSNKGFHKLWVPLRTETFFKTETQKEKIARELENVHTRASLHFIILENGHEEVIGEINFNNIVWGAFQSCHLGYSIGQDFQNQGFMTEALEQAIHFIFTEWKLHRIEANIIPGNKASIRVADKLGFVNEGLSPKYLKINGVWQDHYHYVLLNEISEKLSQE